MLQTAGRSAIDGPVMGQACPRLLGAGRFTMAMEKGSTISRTNVPQPQLRRINTLAWVLECFTQGHMEVGIEQGPLQRVEPGWSMLYNPGTRYHERVDHGQRCHSIVLYFDPGESRLLDSFTARKPAYRFIRDSQQQLTPLARQIDQRIHGHAGQQLAAMGDFLQAMSLLCDATDDGQMLVLGGQSQMDLLTRSRQFMKNHLHEPITIAQLASHANMSESGFAHAYRRLAGQSPMNDLRHLRVEAVKAHLLHNRLTLAQIAQLTGFSDAFHLSHAFRKTAGVSPRQFRQQAAGQQVVGS